MTAPEPQPRSRRTLLVVDDDDTFRTRLMRALSERGLELTGAANYDEAVACAERETPELALVDLRLPGNSGLEVVRRLKELDDTTNIVVLTGYGSIATAIESLKLGALTYLTKPVDADQVVAAFAEAIKDYRDVTEETRSLTRAEWEHIQQVLIECDGDVSQAARQLRMHRRSLQRKLSKRPPAERN